MAFDDDETVGLANLAVRGERAWIGGIGVIPSARRRGIGRALMEAVLEEAPPTVTLEVIEQNEPARRLYEQLGFVTRRTLEVWTLAAEVGAAEVRDVEPRPLGQPDLPWQREDASTPPGCERIEVDGGAAPSGSRTEVGIGQLAARHGAVARELLARCGREASASPTRTSRKATPPRSRFAGSVRRSTCVSSRWSSLGASRSATRG